MYKVIFVVIAVFLLSGCTTKHAAVKEFRVNPELKIKSSVSSGCLDKSLKVMQSFSKATIMSIKMNYAQGAHQQYAYSESQWAESPNRAITAQVVKLLRDTKLFKSVLTSKSRSQSDLILEINIEDFMQYFNEESSESYVSAIISLSLLENSTNNVIATNTFSSRVQSRSLDAQGGVEALNSALVDLLEQSNSWFIGVCQ